MVNVLWGLSAMKVDGPQCTAGDILAEFREAMQLEDGKQVDVYRLVPMDPSEVAKEEMLMVHLPCSPFDCKAIEETYQQLQDAEIRNERCQESVMALAEALRVSEMSVQPQEDVQRLQQENSTLRHELELRQLAERRSEQNARGQEECNQELHRQLGDVRHDIERRPVVWQVPPQVPSPGHFLPGDGHVGAPCPPAMLFPNSCLHGSGCGSAPVTPRLRHLPLRHPPAMAPGMAPHMAPHMVPHPMAPPPHAMSAAVPSGRSMASMAQSAFVRRESRTVEMPGQQIMPGRTNKVKYLAGPGRR
eukprot:Skav203030  [mRNA]  locus=scaffold583:397252:398160:+ [translate_table: standard]